MGYEIIIYYLKLPSVDIAIERVKMRVKKGGHNVPEKDIRRRFERSWINFQKIYKSLADSWIIFDTSVWMFGLRRRCCLSAPLRRMIQRRS